MTPKYQLDYFQRALLRNQCKILELLHTHVDKQAGPYFEDKYKQQGEMLTHNFDTLFPELFETGAELPTDTQVKVLEIIDLYDLMDDSYLQLTTEEQKDIDRRKLDFHGFSRLDRYGKEIISFLQIALDSHEFETPGLRVIDGNMLENPPSVPLMPVYEGVLDRYEDLVRNSPRGQVLTKDELLYLIDSKSVQQH